MAANAVPEELRVLVFLTLVGGQTYTLLRDLLSSAKHADQTLKGLMDMLRQHYEPKKVVMAERFRFHRCKQEPGETVAVFEAATKAGNQV